jgi:hypothetical protein
MKTRRFQNALRSIVDEDLRDRKDLWPEVRARIDLETPERKPLRITRPPWALIIGCLILAAGTAAYAAITTFMEQAVELDPSGSRSLVENGLVDNLNLSQTINEITVTLEWAYADSNRIMVAYTISHPSDRENTTTALILEDGTLIPPLAGSYGYVGDGLMSQVENFDASIIRGEPDALQLLFHLEVSPFDLPEDVPTLILATAEPEGDISSVMLEPIELTAPSTFDFEFSVSFLGGRTIEIGEVTEKSGIHASLESAVIAPSDTRFVVCFSGLEPIYTWTPLFSLETPLLDLKDNVNLLSSGRWINDRCYQHDIGASLEDHKGEWVLTATEIIGEKLDPQREQIRIRGPWQFKFPTP